MRAPVLLLRAATGIVGCAYVGPVNRAGGRLAVADARPFFRDFSQMAEGASASHQNLRKSDELRLRYFSHLFQYFMHIHCQPSTHLVSPERSPVLG